MLEGRRIAVVVPVHDEERFLGETLATMPGFVDRIVVVDDASRDQSVSIAQRSPRHVELVRHSHNRGVGAAIVSGYRRALELGAEVVAVMAGDGQMHPDDLEPLLQPVVRGEVDYAKGQRFSHPSIRSTMPRERYYAGRVLSTLTARATGLASLADSQCGYTAISAVALQRIDLGATWKGYGYPNDLLAQLVRAGLRVRDVPVRPVYRGEKSGLRVYHVAIILGLVARAAWLRSVGASRRNAPSPRGAAAPPTAP
jgi:glycosyltransferase involved in cell wall biosynthesis